MRFNLTPPIPHSSPPQCSPTPSPGGCFAIDAHRLREHSVLNPRSKMFKERKIKKLEAAARKGKADEVAKLLDKLEYEHLAQLLQPAWWGTEAADLKTGLRLVEDLCN